MKNLLADAHDRKYCSSYPLFSPVLLAHYRDLATLRSLIMSREYWYMLMRNDSSEFSENSMGLVELQPSKTVFHLKTAVHQSNTARLFGCDAISLEVCENGSDVSLSPAKVLSTCSSGSSECPFYIRYQGTNIFVLFACGHFHVSMVSCQVLCWAVSGDSLLNGLCML